MELNCPYCRKPIPTVSLNLNSDFGSCGHCHTVFSSDLVIESENSGKIIPPPAGSTLTLRKGDDNSVEVFLPAKKFGLSDILPLIYCILSIGAIVFATFRFLDLIGIYALFILIPAWLNGLFMFGGFIVSLDEEQIITIKNSSIKINKIRPVYSQIFTFDLKSIDSIYTDEKKSYNPLTVGLYLRCTAKSGFGELKTPLIITREKTYSFFEYASKMEQAWIVYLLNTIAKRCWSRT